MRDRNSQLLTRRNFLTLAGAGVAGAALFGAAGCDQVRDLPGPLNRHKGEPGMNVVLVILDSLRKDHVGAYGNTWIHTPNLDALAKESLRFTNAHPESFPTICARRAIHSGTRTWPFRNWHRTKGDDITLWGWEPIPEDQTTLARVMKDNGYATMFVTDNMHQFKPSYNMHQGFDAFFFIRGQTTDNYKPKETAPMDMVDSALLAGNPPAMKAQMMQYFANVAGRESEEDWFSPTVFTRATEYLEWATNAGQPFFLTVDSYDPHEPWDVPDKYVNMYDDPDYSGKEPYSVVYGPASFLTQRELKRMHARYCGEVTMADRWLGHFLDKMEELKLMDNTLLILLSDHGVAFGEHGIVGKPPYCLWPEVTDITYFIRHPEGKKAGESHDYMASTHDVATTVLGFLGIEAPEQMEGEDLSVIFDGGEPGDRPHLSAGYDKYEWARDDKYVTFMRYNGKEARLYDIQKDPNMTNDIAIDNLKVLNKMYNDYILADAGGSIPTYEGAPPA